MLLLSQTPVLEGGFYATLRKILILLAVLSCLTMISAYPTRQRYRGPGQYCQAGAAADELEWTPLQDVYQWSYEGVFQGRHDLHRRPMGSR
jgi:hypothetical protein